MKRFWIGMSAALLGFAAVGAAHAAPVLMSPDWAKEACAAWNGETKLTDGLVKSGWVENDRNRGYKVIHIYRTDCKDSHPVELRIATKGPAAKCVYGGAIENAKLDGGADYLMHAKTARWVQMGKGDYGPFTAMLTGRLKFEGPKMEAMANMDPFEQFLLLVGKVPSDTGSCPK
ncbi:MAG: SCP2 sterol-binding domain-containing protein [Betaproteobacteria bacterium]|nr:SCP2 sterol-binding domain-containing protein [Betaproteobacteria bacterium]